MSDLIKLTGLWKSKTKRGETLLSGSLNAVTSIVILPNSYKKSEKDPDSNIYLKAREKDAAAAKPAAPASADELDF